MLQADLWPTHVVGLSIWEDFHLMWVSSLHHSPEKRLDKGNWCNETRQFLKEICLYWNLFLLIWENINRWRILAIYLHCSMNGNVVILLLAPLKPDSFLLPGELLSAGGYLPLVEELLWYPGLMGQCGRHHWVVLQQPRWSAAGCGAWTMEWPWHGNLDLSSLLILYIVP